MEYSGMKEIVLGVWKERENMNADMKWLDNPEVFKVNQLESRSGLLGILQSAAEQENAHEADE